MSLQLKGKRRLRPTKTKEKKQAKKSLLDLPQANPTEPILVSAELGLRPQTGQPTFETAKGEPTPEFPGTETRQESLPAKNPPLVRQQDIATEKANEAIVHQAIPAPTGDAFIQLKNDIVPIRHQQIEPERLGDEPHVFGPVNELFWERFREEISKAVKQQEKLDQLAFEAAPTRESERVRKNKPVAYAKTNALGYLQF